MFQFIKPGVNIDFVGRRKIAFVLSSALIIASVLVLIWRGGPNYGVDFSGGVLVQVKLDRAHSPSEIKKALQPVRLEDSIIQEFGQVRRFEYLVEVKQNSGNPEEGVKQALISRFGDEVEIGRPEKAEEGILKMRVRFDKKREVSELTEAVAGFKDNLVEIKDLGQVKEFEYLIRVRETDIELAGLSDKVKEALIAAFGEGLEMRRVEMVGPKVGEDLRQKALFAIFYAILFIAIYISGRFEYKWTMSIVMALSLAFVVYVTSSLGVSVTWLIVVAMIVTLGLCWFLKLKYALGAVIALIHDVTITLGAFALTNREISLSIIAALLTIVGYSLNDTIIVFDRIRENVRRFRRRPFEETMNASINQTLSRTILTSSTTLVVIVVLFILGGGVIHDFAFAITIGIIVGTYSSIFVASPVLLIWEEKFSKGAREKKGILR